MHRNANKSSREIALFPNFVHSYCTFLEGSYYFFKLFGNNFKKGKIAEKIHLLKSPPIYLIVFLCAIAKQIGSLTQAFPIRLPKHSAPPSLPRLSCLAVHGRLCGSDCGAPL